MRRLIYLTLLVLVIVGCSQKDVVSFNEHSTLVIEEQVDSESVDYEMIREIGDKETVQEIINILQDAKWQTNIEVQMDREPDYKLHKNYHIWKTPQSDMLEMINIDNSNYVRLSESNSKDLYKFMTGNDLEFD